ncbi:MAG: FAD:protein FMN transferase [Bacteroidales bacterium]|nr:FAD:protein FMN transferase [Bacteroidales bacterium]
MMKRITPYLILIASVASSCTNSTLYQSHAGLTQGTTFNIVYQEKPFLRPERINRAIDLKLKEIDNSLSVYNDSSLISAINRNETTAVDTMFAEVFRLSEKISLLTDGLFDITVGPLVRTWGFGPDALDRFDPDISDSLMAFVGYRKVRLSNGNLVKDDPRIWIDVNAIAQGYSVDVIAKLLDDFGIENYLVEIGGEVRARGVRVDRLWRVGVDMPEDNNNSPGEKLVAVVELDNEALATSGNYRKFHIDEGIKYSHTIDPRLGTPARNRLLSATIIAGDAATADAFATACMVAGPDGAREMIEKYDFLEGYLIYSGDQGEYLTWISEGLKSKVKEE